MEGVILQLYYKWTLNIDIKEKYGYTKYIKTRKKGEKAQMKNCKSLKAVRERERERATI